MALSKRNLKKGLFRNPLHQDGVEKYIIENKEDLDIFFKAFPDLANFKTMAKNYVDSIKQGYTIIADDPHPTHGLNTYCYETKDTTCTHPSSYIRIKLIVD